MSDTYDPELNPMPPPPAFPPPPPPPAPWAQPPLRDPALGRFFDSKIVQVGFVICAIIVTIMIVGAAVQKSLDDGDESAKSPLDWPSP